MKIKKSYWCEIWKWCLQFM